MSLSMSMLGIVVSLLLANPAAATRYTWVFDIEPEQVTPDGSGSTGSGQAWLYYDTLTDHLQVNIAWSVLEADLSAIHIHGPALPGQSSRTHLVDIFSDASAIPSELDRRTDFYQAVVHLFTPHSGGSSHNHGGVPTGIPPEDALAAMVAEEAYILLHSDDAVFFGGELRGQLALTETLIPEPGTATLMALGLIGLALRSRPVRFALFR
ncbi:MAG: CHRD domain-containing protein [Deltaproteobacteria bacterium]|nr:CHRD domain-containing protein [Deltaproteobacteria bacterium]MBW2421245.1 CHRD domain-containing protein [Deltaproteobacteria bacterium]